MLPMSSSRYPPIHQFPPVLFTRWERDNMSVKYHGFNLKKLNVEIKATGFMIAGKVPEQYTERLKEIVEEINELADRIIAYYPEE